MDHVAVHVGQPAFDAVVVVAQPLVIEAQQVQDRGVEVVDRADVLDRLVAELVGRAVAEAALHARAGQPDGEALRVVVAAAGALLERRHAAELGDPDDQRVVEQAALFQVVSSAAAGWSRIGPWMSYCSLSVLCPSQLPTPSPIA